MFSSGLTSILQERANPLSSIDCFQLIGCVETKQAKFLLSQMSQRVSGLLQRLDLFQLFLYFSFSLQGGREKYFWGQIAGQQQVRSPRRMDYHLLFYSFSNV